MTTYIYFVKCPNCEDEHFDFFDEAKEFALGCLSQKPIITQTEVCRNDFGECTDSADLGTVWSWEDVMKDTEPDGMVFSKDETFGISEGLDDFDDFDIGPQIDEFDNSLDFDDVSIETLWVAENLNGGEIVAACWADSEDLAHRLLSQAFRERTGRDLRDCYIREAEADEPDYIANNPELLAEALTEEFDRVKAAAQCMRNCYDFYEAIASKKPQTEINKHGKKAYKFVKDRFGLVDGEAEDLLWSGYVLWKRFHENKKTESLIEAKTDPFHEAIFEAIDYLTEFNDIFPVPETIGADSWGELKDDINYGLSSDFEIAEIIMEYLDKDLVISRKHPEMFEDDPQSELTLETYNRLKRAYDRAVAAYEAEHPEDFKESCEKKPITEATEMPSDDYYVITTTEGTTRFYIKKIDFGFEALPEDPYDWFTTDLSKAQTFSSAKMAGEYFMERKLADNVFALGPNNRRVRYYDYVKTPYECWLIDAGYIKEACSERKPIPEGMTIEQLVEEMEENEDTVECTSCQDLFDKSECRKELNLGWLCRRCADDLTARGERPVFKEDNYWDFLDEDAEPHDPQTWVCYFDGVDIGTVEAATEDEALEKMQQEYPEYPYGKRKHDDCWWVEPAAADNLTEASLGDILRNVNDEYGTDYTEQGIIDSEGLEDADAFDDIETGIELYHDAQERKRARREYAINKAKAAKNQDDVNAFDLDFPEV